MYKSNLKKKLFAALATVCAFVLLLVGIPFAAAPASAAETPEIQPMGTYIPDVPKCLTYKEYCAAVFEYYGDNAEDTYMHLGTNINTNYGYSVKTGYKHTVIGIPYTGYSSLSSKYYWIRAFTTVNSQLYQSNLAYVSKSEGSSKSLTKSINSGVLSRRTWYDYSYDSTGKSKVYFTCVYNGEYKSDVLGISLGKKVTYSTEVAGVTFEVHVYDYQVSLRVSKAINCGLYSEADTGIGGFAFAVE